MKYLFALILTLASFASSYAESRTSMVTTVPFVFVIGSRTFPAGTYTISRISDDPQEGLLIQSLDGEATAFFRPLTSEPAWSNNEARLQFRHQGSNYILAEVVDRLEIYTVAPSRHKDAVNPDETVVITDGP